MQGVNLKNWTYTRYQKGDFMALITFGADPESVKEDCLEYYVTVLEHEIHESFKEKFNSLADACMFLNGLSKIRLQLKLAVQPVLLTKKLLRALYFVQ